MSNTENSSIENSLATMFLGNMQLFSKKFLPFLEIDSRTKRWYIKSPTGNVKLFPVEEMYKHICKDQGLLSEDPDMKLQFDLWILKPRDQQCMCCECLLVEDIKKTSILNVEDKQVDVH